MRENNIFRFLLTIPKLPFPLLDLVSTVLLVSMRVDCNLISASCACSSLRLDLVFVSSPRTHSALDLILPKYSQSAGRLSRAFKIFSVNHLCGAHSVPFFSHLISTKSSDRAAMRLVPFLILLENYSSGCSEQFSHTSSSLSGCPAIASHRLSQNLETILSRWAPRFYCDRFLYKKSFLVQSLRLTVVRPPPPAFPNAITCGVLAFFSLFILTP